MIGFPGQALDDLTEQLRGVNAKLDRLIEIQLQFLCQPSGDCPDLALAVRADGTQNSGSGRALLC